MKRHTLITLIITFVLFAGYMTANIILKPSPEKNPFEGMMQSSQAGKNVLGKSATDIMLTTLEGNTFHLSDYTGENILIIHFFSGMNVTMEQAQLQALSDVQARYTDKPVMIIGAFVGKAQRLFQIMAMVNTTMTVGILSPESSQHIVGAYGIVSDPTTVIIGADGKIVSHIPGPIQNMNVALETTIKKELQKMER